MLVFCIYTVAIVETIKKNYRNYTFYVTFDARELSYTFLP